LARYDYLGLQPEESESKLAALKKLNPNQLHFTTISATETCWSWYSDELYKAVMNKVPSEWFLTQQGSKLSADVDETKTTISVETVTDGNGQPLFAAGDSVTCGFESMLVKSVNTAAKTLEVERGFYRSAKVHSSGERIAAHIVYWPGSWVMNLSTMCPSVDVGNGSEKWGDWAVREFIPAFFSNQRDGYINDRLESTQSGLLVTYGNYARNIDPDCSNVAVSDYSAFDDAWYNGIRKTLPAIRSFLSGKPLIGNALGAYNDLLNGTIWESCPGNWSDSVPETTEGWKDVILGNEGLGQPGYISVSKSGFSPNYSLVETYQLEEYQERDVLLNIVHAASFKLDYQRMRFGLTTALLGNGFFSYELNTNGHGSLGLFWFDEYDNAGKGKGYLGKPVNDAFVVSNGVYRRDFNNGIVLCNPTDNSVVIDLKGSFTLIKGTQVPDINTGKTVTQLTLAPHDGRILLK
ncbi:MAG TPA: putative glycoside hydrolase, partial [Bacillota bacterium]|nr:putative glycoside hydrolase [Bacillota bacterium]